MEKPVGIKDDLGNSFFMPKNIPPEDVLLRVLPEKVAYRPGGFLFGVNNAK